MDYILQVQFLRVRLIHQLLLQSLKSVLKMMIHQKKRKRMKKKKKKMRMRAVAVKKTVKKMRIVI